VSKPHRLLLPHCSWHNDLSHRNSPTWDYASTPPPSYLLGIAPDQTLYALDNRPYRLIGEGTPLIKEAIA
jgi:hypothetical protein